MEAVHGVSKEVQLTRKDTCWTCEGTGSRPGHKKQTCPTCNGQGQVIRSQGFFQMSSTCPQCHGEGSIVTDPCNDCHGTGLVEKTKKVALKIPAGVDTGARMRLSGEGEGGRRGGTAGDFMWSCMFRHTISLNGKGIPFIAVFPYRWLRLHLVLRCEIPTVHGKENAGNPCRKSIRRAFHPP